MYHRAAGIGPTSEASAPGARAAGGAGLNVGVTGHRATRLSVEALRALPATLDAVLGALAAAAAPIVPVLHTALATGADQLAAEAARGAGYRVHAMLPFAADAYAADFAIGEERDRFAAQHAAACRVTALAGRREDAAGAYIAVGQAVVAASELIVAVWDGVRTIVPGGTAHVVALALAAGRPVIHLPVRSVPGSSERAAIGTPVLLRRSDDQGEPIDYAALVRELGRRG